MNFLQTYQDNKSVGQQSPLPQNSNVKDVYSQSTTTLKEETWTLKEKLVYGLIAALGLSGAIYVTKRFVIKKISDSEELKSFTDGSDATIAKQIKMAFENDGWWGTNTEALRQAIISVPSQQDWQDVISSYKKQYAQNLIRELADKLQSTEYNEMMQIIAAKPLKKGQTVTANQYRAWAKRLKSAFDKSYGFLPGTDTNAVTVTLNEIPTQRAIINTGVEYKKLFGTDFMADLKGEGEFGQYDDWLKIIVNKKKS